MYFLRCLFFVEAWVQFEVVAVHIPGTLNTRADDLYRDRLSSFFLTNYMRFCGAHAYTV